MGKTGIIFAIMLLLCGCEIKTVSENAHADLIIFSFDRPLQLYALLESIEQYVNGIDRVVVICRASDNEFEYGYQVVKDDFPSVHFWYQQHPPHDFKKLTLDAIHTCLHEHIMFAVDDMVVTDYIDILSAVELLRTTNSYGFFYRLGLHLTYCYSLQQPQQVPTKIHIVDDVYQWCFKDGEHDWCYPHTVDMTLYRTKDVLERVADGNFKSPNTFEGHWVGKARKVLQRKGLFHEHTKTVNLPLNMVRCEYSALHMNAFTTKELLDMFLAGKKMNIAQLYRIDNNAAHMEYVPSFVLR